MSVEGATLHEVVTTAKATLELAGVPSPGVDAVELAAFILDVAPGEVQRRMVLRAPITEDAAITYAALIHERARRVPLQHLTGRAYFRGLTLAVGPGVFIPRPETEVVAGWAIDAARDSDSPRPIVVDLCTESGAIALAIADEVPHAEVHAIELSEHAHAWAAQNVERLGLPVNLVLGDAITSFGELWASVDVVVSNPPYIPTGQVPIDPEVAEHDPRVALFGGSADGLSIPRLVAARAATLLRPGGVLVMEHADSQGESLPRALAQSGNWVDIEDRLDLNGRPRATVARRGHDQQGD